MIEPFEENPIKKGIISYGLSSYGYDIRLADEFKIFTNVFNSIVDPKNFDPKSFVDYKGNVCVIPPNSFILGRSVEYLRIPRKFRYMFRKINLCKMWNNRKYNTS